MTRKEEKELYTITGNEKKEESFIKWSLISLAVCLTITFGVLIYGKFAGENATHVINIITFILFIIVGVLGALLLFFSLKYSDDIDYSKYAIVEKEYLKELEKKVKNKKN